MMWYWGSGMGWGGILIGGIISLAVLVGIVLLIVWAVRKGTESHGTGPGMTGQGTPLDIAKERYAKGEITREQFEQIKRDLS